MPELPEVETVRLGLIPVLVGHRVAAVSQARSDLRFPLPPGFADRVRDRRVTAIERRGKYLLIHLDDRHVLLVHLGMSGRFRVIPAGEPVPPPQPHDHVTLISDAGVTLRYCDPRRFGFMDLFPESALATHPRLAALGPEPLSDAFNQAVLEHALTGRITTIKAALLDQRLVAGLGNIYVCESLFRAGLSPRRQAGSVRGRRAARLVGAIRAVLVDAIRSGGSSLRDHRSPSGQLGTFQHGFAVYGRTGLACPGCTCDAVRTGGIRRIVQAGRSTFFCPKRQH
ncbi:MAG: bifunctional DNA-formamidopyrimidine glycosylase/DNA-(apurinic or apyrimidinic site) lyase [Rhodospirillales bacterium]|nr:MAG: bifunctional DNA-formamidopyrimidine glycosylase/DNA-(apurinic or apyrimidinic site) lyase [Rhodospirillales bacterium]